MNCQLVWYRFEELKKSNFSTSDWDPYKSVTQSLLNQSISTTCNIFDSKKVHFLLSIIYHLQPTYSLARDIWVGISIYVQVWTSHHGPTETRFFASARATNGLGTFTGLLWKVLRGFKNISRGALGDNGH